MIKWPTESHYGIICGSKYSIQPSCRGRPHIFVHEMVSGRYIQWNTDKPLEIPTNKSVGDTIGGKWSIEDLMMLCGHFNVPFEQTILDGF